jgi:hypothetical protein
MAEKSKQVTPKPLIIERKSNNTLPTFQTPPPPPPKKEK